MSGEVSGFARQELGRQGAEEDRTGRSAAGAERAGRGTPSVCSPMRRKNQSPPKPRTNGIRSTAKAVNSLRARNANVASRATS